MSTLRSIRRLLLASFLFMAVLASCNRQKTPPARAVAEQKPATTEQAQTKAVKAADPSWIVRFDGIGPVRVGMTLAQLNEVLGEKFEMPTDKEEQGCFNVQSSSHHGVSFMIEDGILTRIDAGEPGVSTEQGIQVGDLDEKVRQKYGARVKVEPHHYIPENGSYLTVHSANGRYGIRFETDDKKITSFYVGTAHAIQYVEGCL